MAIALLGIEVRHERRLLVTFTNALAAGAFATPGPSFYSITSSGLDTTAPTVLAALIVPGAPACVELALSNDLVRGSLYTLTTVGVPATDATVTPAGTSTPFQLGVSYSKSAVEPAIRDRERLVFQVDLIWNGLDYEEATNGDLSRVEGRANVTKGLWRSIETAGLPWDPTWGVNAREWVDSPSPAGNTLRGELAAQIARDPRVRSVVSTVTLDNNKTYINIVPTLISGLTIDPVSTTVDNAT